MKWLGGVLGGGVLGGGVLGMIVAGALSCEDQRPELPPATEQPVSAAASRHFPSDVRARLRCEWDRLRGSDVTCPPAEGPHTAQLDRVVELVFDQLDQGEGRSAGNPTWRCQDAIRKAAQHFVGQRVQELRLLHRRSATGAKRFVEEITKSCGEIPKEGGLPVVGGDCSSLADPFDATQAAYCVRGAFEAIAQEVSGVRLRPNILFVLTDDQRWDTLDVMPLLREHVTDRGIEFSESFTSTSLCCPDRASILTGLYAHNHGVKSNDGALTFDHDRDTIPRRLHEQAGYKTALIGKYMVFTKRALGNRIPPGWDEWQVFLSDLAPYYNYFLNTNGKVSKEGLRPKSYSTDLLGRRTLRLLDRWQEVPWLILLAPFAPHTPATPARRHIGRFADLPPWRPPSYLEGDMSDKPSWVRGKQMLLKDPEKAIEKVDARRRSQLEALLAVDEVVAGLSQRLEDLGLTDNTLLVFTSDNGFAWLEHWLQLKNYPYEESIRVPLLVRYPLLVHAPRKERALVQSIDFYPTFAELAGVRGASINGRSLVPLLSGEEVDWRDAILIEHFEGAGIWPSRGVRTHRWKLIETDAPRGVTLELYDLETDPYELENVAADPQNTEVVAALKARLEDLAAK